jgi:flavorubredoxin
MISASEKAWFSMTIWRRGSNPVKKAIIVYESKYGNTKLVAEGIAEGMRKASPMEVVVSEVKSTDVNQLSVFDAVLIGSPNHMGKPVSNIRRFINGLGVGLEGKQVAVFDTYTGANFGKAVKKMEEQIVQEGPGLKLMSPGLSIMVDGTKGPIAASDITKVEEFGTRIAALMTG